MALLIATSTPSTLLADIKQAIDDGHIDTWQYDDDGAALIAALLGMYGQLRVKR
jgi:hypothetical protein